MTFIILYPTHTRYSKKDNSVTLKVAWEMYKMYCDTAKVPYPMSMRVFKNELRNYFRGL